MNRLHLLAPAVALALGSMGCAVRAEPIQPTFTVEASYTPLRYQGYVVYYDDGVPFYVVQGRRYYIPRSSPHYHRYVRHYRTYRDRDGYRDWRRRHEPRYETRGPRYRSPRRHHEPR